MNSPRFSVLRRLMLALAVLLVAATLAPSRNAAAAPPGQLGVVTDFDAQGDTYTVTAGTAKVRVVFEDADLFRIWLAPDGQFTDPANADPDPADPDAPDADIVVKRDYAGADSHWSDQGDHYLIRTNKAALRVFKDPLRFALYDAANQRLIWAETQPLSWNDNETTQTLARGATEQFFGTGMQNGSFSHRDQTVEISRDYNWDEGGHPNAVPFYASTAGYGVLRNTFAPGSYAFTDPVTTRQDEQRFDAYYFVGDLKDVIDGYTELTGRPFLPPMYGLEMGDADCYNHNANRGERDTLTDATAIADGYASPRYPARVDARQRRLRLRLHRPTADRRRAPRQGHRARPVDRGGPDRAAVRGRRGRRGSPQDRRRLGRARLPVRPGCLRTGPRRHRRLQPQPRSGLDDRGLGRHPTLRRAVERRPVPAPGTTSAGRSPPTPAPRCPVRPTPAATSTASSAAARRPTPATCSGRCSCR